MCKYKMKSINGSSISKFLNYTLQIRSIHEKALNLARIPYISLVLNATSKDYNCKIPR
jgi:hypothetical protein